MRAVSYMPGLDGLRALSVIAVFLFHAGMISGGFIGVDLFFFISGFLITGLAVAEVERTGKLALGAFWRRRVRRLFPAILAVCFAVLVAAVLFRDADLVRSLRTDVIATLFYVSNWVQIGQTQDYFATFETPSPLRHTWSLAIEEQFYVAWPIIIVGLSFVAKRTGRQIRTLVLVAATVATLASLAWSHLLASHESTSTTRLYYGTDVRISLITAGAAAACIMLQPGWRTQQSRLLTVAGLGSFAWLAGLSVIVDGSERWWYSSGQASVIVASVFIVSSAMDGTSGFGRLLSVTPLVDLGRVSYGIYLWHWPVIVLLDEERVGLDGWRLVGLWALVTGVLTTASWFAIERRAPLPGAWKSRQTFAYVAGFLTVLVASAAAASVTPTTSLVATEAITGVTTTTTSSSSLSSSSTATATTLPTASTTTRPAVLPHYRPLRILILGDSVAESLGDPDDLLDITEIGLVDVQNNGVVACPIWTEGHWIFYNPDRIAQDPAFCEGDDRFQAEVDEFEPDLILMMFGWSGGVPRGLDDGTEYWACDPVFIANWQSSYEHLVDRFGDQADIVVADVVDYIGTEQPPHADMTKCLNDAIASAGFHVLDLRSWLCPNGDCAALADLRRDGLHFTVEGEAKAALWNRIIGDAVAATVTSADD